PRDPSTSRIPASRAATRRSKSRYYRGMRQSRITLFAVAVLAAGSMAAQGQHPAYPPTSRGDVVDDYFGTKVPDPYRWMEDLDAKAVADWIAAENAITERYLATLPLREKLRKRITELWNYPKVSTPFI